MTGRSDRGAVFPSPVVMLSIVAVVMAGIAYVATRGEEPTEREVATVSQEPEAEETTPAPPPEKKKEKPKPSINRGETYVVVFNNSGITGLAGRVAGEATDAGWNVVGSDNWYGSVPANTVYYPRPLRAEADQLALDLGIRRTAPAVDPMQLDRLTVILTGEV
jgi:hypothetical protein